MTDAEKNNEEKKTSTGKKYSIRDFFGGDILVQNFFIKQLRLIILIVVFLMIFITNRYSMIKKIIQKEDLKKELTDIRYDNQIISTKLIKSTRPAEVEKMLKERNIELIDPIEPAYEISK